LKDGRKLVTLDDARAFMIMLRLPELKQLAICRRDHAEAADDNRAGFNEAYGQLRRARLWLKGL
jgi:hypothetical protein